VLLKRVNLNWKTSIGQGIPPGPWLRHGAPIRVRREAGLCTPSGDTDLATRQELSDFLESVERRAFKQAVYAVRNDESALDVVQDSMMRLAEKYGDRPVEELPMLFQRILQNAIRDWFRRSKVRSFWTTLFRR